MGKNTESLQKIHWRPTHSLSRQRQLVHWLRWVPGTLTQQEKPVLQGARPPEDNSRFLGPALHLHSSGLGGAPREPWNTLHIRVWGWPDNDSGLSPKKSKIHNINHLRGKKEGKKAVRIMRIMREKYFKSYKVLYKPIMVLDRDSQPNSLLV